MPVRAIVFDLFDTLVDLFFERIPRVDWRGRAVPSTAIALHAAVSERAEISFDDFGEALAAVDEGFRESHYAKGRELPTEERFTAVVRRLGLEDPDLPEVLTSIHMGILREQVEVPAHHADLLQALGRRVRLGLCSNFSHTPTALAVLKETGLRSHLGAVVISETLGWRKPREEIFQAVLDELGVSPAETLHVGDSLRADVGGAAALGIRTVWITRRIADPSAALAAHRGPPPDWSIHDLAELPRLLEQS